MAAARIAGLISEYGLQPGDRLLTERALGDQLGVSRTVIREAVKMLAATGLVQARQGSGLYVGHAPVLLTVATIDLAAPLDPEHILNAFELRGILEMQTARLAAERITPRELQILRVAEEMTRAGAEADQWDLFNDGDCAFHQGMAEATHNPFLAASVASVKRLCSRALALALVGVPGSLAVAAAQHASILEAIREGNGAAAAAAMDIHLQTTAGSYRQEVRRRLAARVTAD